MPVRVLIVDDEHAKAETKMLTIEEHLPGAEIHHAMTMESLRGEYGIGDWTPQTYFNVGWNELTDREIREFDLVILDSTLKEWERDGEFINGAEILRELRARGFTGPVLANSVVDELNQRLLKLGANEVALVGRALTDQIRRLLDQRPVAAVGT